jgi:hypothetical protein
LEILALPDIFLIKEMAPFSENTRQFLMMLAVLSWMVGRLNFAKVAQLLSQLKIDDKLGTKYLNFLFI